MGKIRRMRTKRHIEAVKGNAYEEKNKSMDFMPNQVYRYICKDQWGYTFSVPFPHLPNNLSPYPFPVSVKFASFVSSEQLIWHCSRKTPEWWSITQWPGEWKHCWRNKYHEKKQKKIKTWKVLKKLVISQLSYFQQTRARLREVLSLNELSNVHLQHEKLKLQ